MAPKKFSFTPTSTHVQRPYVSLCAIFCTSTNKGEGWLKTMSDLANWRVDNLSGFFKDTASGIPSLSHIHFTELDIELACSERSSTSSADASHLKFCRKEGNSWSWIYTPWPLTFSLSLFALYIREAEGLNQKITGQWHLQATSLEYLKELSGRPWLPILKSIVYFLMTNIGSEPEDPP